MLAHSKFGETWNAFTGGRSLELEAIAIPLPQQPEFEGKAVPGNVERRRKSYLAKIREAEEQAAKSNDERVATGFLTVAEGYRVLLRRLERRQKSKPKTSMDLS